jgi:DNA-binding transcriptional ArsR family regulator
MDVVLQALCDPSRRAILEQLRRGQATAGELGRGLALTQPGVSRHLRVLREAELVAVEERGRQRVYSLLPAPLTELDSWLEPYRDLWSHRLDALHTEIARGKRARNQTTSEGASP